jgi:ATP-binding cassette subfamily F protein 3
VLDDYAGTILLVTHDRYLIDALGTQIWEIDPDESSLDVFEGTYSQRKEERERLAALRVVDGVRNLQTADSEAKSRRRETSDSARAERRRLAKIQELENKIAALETELAGIGTRLENPPADPARVAQMGKDYARVQAEMDALLSEWEQIQN